MTTRRFARLSAAFVSKVRTPGRYADGEGLFLQVTTGATGSTNKSWVVRFRAPCGRVREMGLGVARYLPLANARAMALAARALVAEGVDPIEHREAERTRLRDEAASATTFREAAQKYLDAHRHTWKNAKHQQQWDSTLDRYAYPVMGNKRVRDINVDHVLQVIEPLWKHKTETANRVRQRIERILDWAKSRRLREGDNPARWRGHLEHILPNRSVARRVRHHPALPYDALPAFMSELRRREGLAARALEFTILTAARTGEVINARWREMDLAARLWTVPSSRMKSAREHKVPLSTGALRLLRAIKFDRGGDDWVFPGLVAAKPLSSMAMLALLHSMGRDTITVHGFRSSFRDWVSEATDHPREVAEAALAHVVGDKVEAAYRRGDLFEKRRNLMDDWSLYCVSPSRRQGF
jgi:integrase